MTDEIAGQQDALPPIQRPKLGRGKTIIGVGITIGALIFLAIYMTSQWYAFVQMTPDRFATFLAGVFAPLAFLWLVLGFFQQGDELRHSADALWLQGEELRHSVEQQRQLVGVTREQLQFENTMLEHQREEMARNAQPILRLIQGGSGPASERTRTYGFSLLNHGKPCTGLKFNVEDKIKFERNALAAGGTIDFNLELPFNDEGQFNINVAYLDERLMSGSKTFIVSRANGTFEITEAP